MRKKKSKSLKEHVENLNKKFTITSKYELKEKNTIIGEQFKCYCMVKNAKKTFKNKNYCQCSVGCRKKFFEALFGKDVRVELVDSIVNGGKSCKFLIQIQNERR